MFMPRDDDIGLFMLFYQLIDRTVFMPPFNGYPQNKNNARKYKREQRLTYHGMA